MESRPLLTSFQIGGSAGDALPGNETRHQSVKPLNIAF
jgi:hypothetical protein